MPLFVGIPYAHLIHDDLIVAAPSMEEHNKTIKKIMEKISTSGLTLNPGKCQFGKEEIEFWRLPDPAKVEALEYNTPLTSKEELISFLCMMQ